MFDVTLIPQIMRNFGMTRGAQLMEAWFGRPAAIAPNYGPPVADLITMDWVLWHPVAKNLFDRLLAERIWENPAAQAEIAKMLQRKGFLDASPIIHRFGDLSRPVPLLDEDYVNFRPSPAYTGLDDLTAALGRFAFRVVVSGTVTPGENPNTKMLGVEYGHKVTIDEVGIYVRDSYDFEGGQFLGWWAAPGHSFGPDGKRYYMPVGKISNLPYDGGHLVANSDYNIFRKRRGLGGDFLVYSDIRRMPVDFSFHTSGLINRGVLPVAPGYLP